MLLAKVFHLCHNKTEIMNAIQVSVKTNTVLVCKDLAEAQFRCIECCKAFISERYLAKHNHKRHGFTHYFTMGLEQTDLANDNERKLTEATGRLEKALSLLEAKTSSLDSTASHDRPEVTVRENPQAEQPNEVVLSKSPQTVSDVRRTVSLFTLPYDRACEPVFDGWMTGSPLGGRPKIEDIPGGDVQDASGPDGECLTKKLVSNDDTQNISVPDVPSAELEHLPNETPDGANLESTPQEIPVGASQEVDGTLLSDQKATSIEPLLISLIKKLDTVLAGNRLVTNSFCQTTEPEAPEPVPLTEQSQLEEHCSGPGRKSVRFSDLPIYYGGSEQHFNQSESECSSRSSGSKFEDDGGGFVGNEEFQTYTNYSARSHMTRPVCHHPESAGETQIVYDPDPERTRVLESCPGHSEVFGESSHSPDVYEMSGIKQDVETVPNEVQTPEETEESCTDGDGTDDDCSRSYETAIPAVVPATAAEPPEIEAPNNPHPLATAKTNSKVRQSADYVATKKQILDMVEKCVKDLKEKRKQSISPTPSSPSKPGQSQIRGFTHSDERRNSGLPDVQIANQKLPEARKNSTCRTSPTVICVGNGNITADSQGMLPPCTVICKDEELDIDELSGDSYERFMKRFYSRVSEPAEPGDDPSPASRQHPNSNQPCAEDQHQARQRNRANHPSGASSQQNQAKSGATPRDEMNEGRTDTRSPKKETDLKKADYAVLLHHETSQVQSLIDTLVSDLQRWRNARRDHLSHAIRIQLEERLASNLNLLGIQSNAKLLSDSAAATAHFLLSNRRSKSAKASPTSYFDVLKFAFVNEVDRIAKSRTNNDRNPAM